MQTITRIIFSIVVTKPVYYYFLYQLFNTNYKCLINRK